MICDDFSSRKLGLTQNTGFRKVTGRFPGSYSGSFFFTFLVNKNAAFRKVTGRSRKVFRKLSRKLFLDFLMLPQKRTKKRTSGLLSFQASCFPKYEITVCRKGTGRNRKVPEGFPEVKPEGKV